MKAINVTEQFSMVSFPHEQSLSVDPGMTEDEDLDTFGLPLLYVPCDVGVNVCDNWE